MECWKGSCTNRFIVLGGAFYKKDKFYIFKWYDVDALMKNILVKSANNKKRTLEILLLLCCTIDSVKYLKFKKNEGLSRKTLAISLKALERNWILHSQTLNEIPPS